MTRLESFMASVIEMEKEARDCFEKGTKAAGRRARVALSAIMKEGKELRKDILAKMNEKKA